MPKKLSKPPKPRKENKGLEEETELLDFDKPDFVFIPKGSHEWRQRGPYLVCMSCDLQHATWIGMEKVMVGVDEKGLPILKRRRELGMA